jgi:hypothetical protein
VYRGKEAEMVIGNMCNFFGENMNTKDTFKKIGDMLGKFITYVGLFIWSFIRVIATIITFIIIFALLAHLISLKVSWIVILILLLWFVYANRKKVATVIAVLITLLLALALFSALKYSLFPGWVKIKHFSGGIHLFDKNFGATSIKDQELDSFTSYGAADLDNVTIKGPLCVYGHLDGSALRVRGKTKIYGHAELSDVNFDSELNVYGRIELNKGVVLGKTNIYGKADINKCEMGDLYVYSRKIRLESCTVKNIYVKTSKKEWADKEAVVKLVGTKVQGNVAFDGKMGKVILQSGATVGGKIIGGSVENN